MKNVYCFKCVLLQRLVLRVCGFLFFICIRLFYSIHELFLSAKGLDHVAEKILSYLDAASLMNAEQVCREWRRVIAYGMLWKKLIERMVCTDSMWRGLAERRDLMQFLRVPRSLMSNNPNQRYIRRDHDFYRQLYPKIIKDIQVSVLIVKIKCKEVLQTNVLTKF